MAIDSTRSWSHSIPSWTTCTSSGRGSVGWAAGRPPTVADSEILTLALCASASERAFLMPGRTGGRIFRAS